MTSKISSTLLLSLIGLSAAIDPRLIFQKDAPPPSSSSQQCFDPTTRPRGESNYDCPKKGPHYMEISDDGTCGTIDPKSDNPCVNYCEVRLTWDYGPEVSFDETCQASDDKCSTTSTTGTSVTNSHSFEVGVTLGKRAAHSRRLSARADPASALDRIKAAFNFGASWSWSDTKTNTIAKTTTKPANAAGQCGYWTFVPYYVESCGTLTYADYAPEHEPICARQYPGTEPGGACSQTAASCGTPQTIANFCQTTPYTDSNGKVVGDTVFVATDCSSNGPLGFCYQQLPYLQIGVSATPDTYIEYLYAHSSDEVDNRDISGPALIAAVSDCFEGKWTGPFAADPSWVDGGIGSPAAPVPTGSARPMISPGL